ncbi:calponin-1-like [Limulus polyphemus]|uniref:Calponin-1-like n=1 Tax=Limulus polyphemus TaxID=6850 RepID=A0ABM1T9N1_LIMPO|nr:calponin-1-like [Limulus polyphemus]
MKMAYQGPVYGLSRECQIKSKKKFQLDQALQALDWVREVTNEKLEPPNLERGFEDHMDFADSLKDGIALCKLINILMPGAVPKVNEGKMPFKQMENIEMFLKGCVKYGLKPHDLFQVNDLYERKNLYMVVSCLFTLGGLVS